MRNVRCAGLTREAALLLAVVIGFLVGTGLTETPARAVACLVNPYNTTAQPDTNGRGVRVSNPGMLIANSATTCGRVSSLFDYNSAETRFVEVGWYEEQNYYVCIPNTTAPRRLGFAFFDGLASCFSPSSGISTGRGDFYVHDDNQNAIWNFYHGTSNFWNSPNMGTFVTGQVRSNGERAGASDSAYSDFDGLKRMGATMSWVAWTGTQEWSTSDDPGYEYCEHSNTHVEVQLNADPCP